MRDASSIQFSTTDPLNGLQPKPKSLFRSILAISRCESIFRPRPRRCHLSRSLRINILANSADKMRGARVLDSEAKSLFHNILAVSSFDARIYTDALRSKPGKPLRMNTLRNRHEKNVRIDRRWEDPSLQPTLSTSGSLAHWVLRDESLYPVILITAFFHPRKYSDLACGSSFIGLAVKGGTS